MGKGEGAIGTVPSADGKLSDLDGGDRGDTTPGGVSGSDVPKAESEPSTVPVDEDMRKDSVGDVDGVREIVDDAPCRRMWHLFRRMVFCVLLMLMMLVLQRE